jgi:hypothetical protein
MKQYENKSLEVRKGEGKWERKEEMRESQREEIFKCF